MWLSAVDEEVAPEVCSIDATYEDVGRQHNKGDDCETPAGVHHEDQHHDSLGYRSHHHIHVQADLVGHGCCIGC